MCETGSQTQNKNQKVSDQQPEETYRIEWPTGTPTTGRDEADRTGMDTEGDETHPKDLNLVGEPDHGRPMVSGQVSGVAVKTRAPVPAVRRSKRVTAGTHSNPFHLPKSSCNAITVSTEMVSQVLSLGSALFEKALQVIFVSSGFVTESVDFLQGSV